MQCTALSEEETLRVADTIDDETSIKLDSIPMTISLKQSLPEATFASVITLIHCFFTLERPLDSTPIVSLSVFDGLIIECITLWNIC